MIEIKGLSKNFGLTTALNQVNLKVDNFLTLFGPNGAGKTTLIRILSTLMKPSSGEAKINNIDVLNNPVRARSQIGVISHETHLYDGLKAEENLKFYGKLYNVKNLDKRINSLIKKVGLEHREKDRVADFSRGMRQRLSISRALLHDPLVLLLDEPYTGLDQHAAETLEQILDKFEDRTILQTTHNLERGLKLCCQVAILVDGEIVYKANAEEIGFEELKQIYNQKVQQNE
ncbi:sodium ABC transporter ATP-binding protein [archaeon SCG-AAA382B04]|nr:sodium ABC transporter ATP-binding protein [archaeon SCG-AAA382B04]